MSRKDSHICICICTYKRPQLLGQLLSKLQNQTTDNLFTYSLIIVDNDYSRSAESKVSYYKLKSLIDIQYFNEPKQNIALARNKAVQNAKGTFVAFIDDDELPDDRWLLTLYKMIKVYNAAGILGPVKPHFAAPPPQWVIMGKLFERPSHKTGTVLRWRHTRTGNVLLRKNIFDENENSFDPAFGSGGEDRDFFRRMIEKGYNFIWCDEAPVYEIIPPERWNKVFLLKRALLRGKVASNQPSFDIFKSIVALFIYTMALPIFFLLEYHLFMAYLIKIFDHIGKILASFGFEVVKEKYIMK